MITLMMSVVANFSAGEVIGVILSIAEIFFVICRILACFIPPETKFGKILHRIALSKEKFDEVAKEIKEEQNRKDEDKDG